jgi:hypothetical protein
MFRWSYAPLDAGSQNATVIRLTQYRDAGIKPETIIGWAADSIGIRETDQPVQAAGLVDTFKWSNLRKTHTFTNGQDF